MSNFTKINDRHSAAAIYQALVVLNARVGERFALPNPTLPAPTPTSVQTSLISAKETSRLLGISAKTLANWRSSGTQPLPFIQIGSRILYRQSDIDRCILSRLKTSTSDNGGL